MWLITRNAEEYRSMTAQLMSQNLPIASGPFGIFCVLCHPNHFVLAGANNRNVIITNRFLAAPVQHVQANRVFFYIECTSNSWHSAAPALSLNSILARCVALWNIPIHGKIFTLIFHTIGEINTGNARFHASFKSIYTALIKTFSVSRIVCSKP